LTIASTTALPPKNDSTDAIISFIKITATAL
jgi:hypothetical protein